MSSTKSSAASAKKPAIASSAKAIAGKPKVASAKPNATKVTKKLVTQTQPVTAKAADTSPPSKKTKLVRDSFTLPEADHDLIKECKKIAVAQGRETKKSEVLRAAIRRFATLAHAEQLKAYAELAPVSVGRPKKR